MYQNGPMASRLRFFSRYRDSAQLLIAGMALLLLGTTSARGDDARPPFRNGSPILRPFFALDQDGRVSVQHDPPKSPTEFNPDPGAWDQAAQRADSGRLLLFPEAPILPDSLKLPRGGVLGTDPVRKTFTYRSYPLGREGLGLLPNAEGVPNRWLLP